MDDELFPYFCATQSKRIGYPMKEVRILNRVPNSLSVSCIVVLLSSLLSPVAFGQTIVTGKVTGLHNKPIPSANVFLRSPDEIDPVKYVNVDASGKYWITIDSIGVWLLEFTGALYRDYTVALYVDKPSRINLDIELGAYRYVSNFGNVSIVGDFNRWNVLSPVKMNKRPDGTYEVTIDTKDDTLSYCVKGVRDDGYAIEGTQADRYEYNGKDGYNSVLYVHRGKAKIVFDPRKLPRNSAKMVITSDDKIIPKFAEIYGQLLQYKDSFDVAYRNAIRTGEIRRGFRFNWFPMLSTIKKQIDGEANPILRGELIMNYLTIAEMSGIPDQSISKLALETISPDSPLWSLNPRVVFYTLIHAGITQKEHDDFIKRLMSKNPDVSLKSDVLFDEYMASKLAGNEEKAGAFYDLLVGKYEFTAMGKIVKDKYPDTRFVKIGASIPWYSAPLVEDSTKKISKEAMMGKYYIMFFWKTTDDSCVRVIRYLKRVFDEFHNTDFDIVGFSVDSLTQNVVRFCRENGIDWQNAYLGNSPNNVVVKAFGALNVPKLFLIDPEGKLVAEGPQLEGERLVEILSEYFKK